MTFRSLRRKRRPCSSSESLYSLGSVCVMPLWQSMQVLPSVLACTAIRLHSADPGEIEVSRKASAARARRPAPLSGGFVPVHPCRLLHAQFGQGNGRWEFAAPCRRRNSTASDLQTVFMVTLALVFVLARGSLVLIEETREPICGAFDMPLSARRRRPTWTRVALPEGRSVDVLHAQVALFGGRQGRRSCGRPGRRSPSTWVCGLFGKRSAKTRWIGDTYPASPCSITVPSAEPGCARNASCSRRTCSRVSVVLTGWVS